MKGSIGGSTQLRNAKDAGCSFRRPRPGEWKLLNERRRLNRLHKKLAKQFDSAPRLKK